MEDFFRVGVISSTHGLKGEVKIFPFTDDITRFKTLKDVILDTGKEKITLKVENAKFFKKFVILKFKGINDINDIEKYKGKDIYVNRKDAIPLEEGEYFIADLLGSKVIEDTGIILGELVDIFSTGANDVYVVKTPSNKEILLPSIKECILDIKVEQKEIIVHLLPGLIE